MRTLVSAALMQRQALAWKRAGIRVALVPTMGFLHEGHVDLMRRARRAVGARGKVVVSIYVNPTQFGPAEDHARYPRDLRRDQSSCRAAGVDVVFAPGDEVMYPGRAEGNYSTYVEEMRLSQGMEGASRPTHFRGVTTVVAKLFNLVLPDVAVFGAKDWQQAAVVQRMVADLNFPLKILLAPTSREPDGLARSSRNQYLTPAQRQQATVLWRALSHVRDRVRQSGFRKPLQAERLRGEVRKIIDGEPEARLDYVEFFHPSTLQPVSTVTPGVHCALAVFVGTTRLIDNAGV